MRQFRIASILSLFILVSSVKAQSSFDGLYGANGPVYAVAISGSTVYIGGAFSYVGPQTGHGAVLSATTGAPDTTCPYINGSISAVVPDGSGGWYIGGSFTLVDATTRNHAAHLFSDLSLDPAWDPNANDVVQAIAVSGSTIYMGGYFTSIGGQSRNRIASLHVSDGAASSWNPNANGIVYALSIVGPSVFAGGAFTNIGGQVRARIAAIDTGTGLATAWTSNADNAIYSIVPSGSVLFVGGAFTFIGGQTRNRIASLSVSSGTATTWNANADNTVNSVAISGSLLLAGGTFTTIGGQARNRIAALDTSAGSATGWNPNADNSVNVVAVSGATVYAGGIFTNIGGQSRLRMAALDTATGTATSWTAHATNIVVALAVAGSNVFAGGGFTSIGGQTRNNVAALDAVSGALTAWDPNANNFVYALAVANGTVYAGGQFTSIGGSSRNRIAALDATTGNATSWDPNADNRVRALAVSGSTVFAGGEFASIGGQTRFRVAGLDAVTGTATGLSADVNAIVYAITKYADTLYIGGEFTNIGGQARNRLAGLVTSTGSLTSWDPDANGRVQALALSNGAMLAAGYFTSVGGQARNYVAAIDVATADPTAWDPNANSGVNALLASGSTIYAAGQFTSIGGQPRNYLAALDAASGSATSWYPNPDILTTSLAVDAARRRLYVGGGFTTIANSHHSSIAGLTNPDDSTLSPPDGSYDTSFGDDGILVTAFGSGNDGARALTIQSNGKILVAGYSDTGVADDWLLLRYTSDGALDTTFGSDGVVYTPMGSNDDRLQAVEVRSDGMILATGDYNDTGVFHIGVARYDSSGNLDPSFAGDGTATLALGTVDDRPLGLALMADGRPVVAGYTHNGSNRDVVVVRYLNSGTLDSGFDGDGVRILAVGSGNEEAADVVVQGNGKIVVAGYASNGSDKDILVARFDSTGALDAGFGSGGIVTTPIGSGDDVGLAVALQADGKIVVAGCSFNGSVNVVAVLRYNANGTLDTDFDGDGIATATIGSGTDVATDVTLQLDGSIIVAPISTNGSDFDFSVLRFLNDGSLDASFGTGGKIVTPLGPGNDIPFGVALQSSGAIIVAGESSNGSNADVALVRYVNSGTPLAAEMTRFSASAVANGVLLAWSTATETDNAGWQIERREIEPVVNSKAQEEKGGEQRLTSAWGVVGFVAGSGTRTSPKEYAFSDHSLFTIHYSPSSGPMRLAYRLKQLDRSGAFRYSGEVEVEIGNVPNEFALQQNYPNPFNPSTTIRFTLANDARTTLTVFDLLGREVARLVDQDLKAGVLQQAVFDAKGLSSGVFVIVLRTEGRSIARRMMLLK